MSKTDMVHRFDQSFFFQSTAKSDIPLFQPNKYTVDPRSKAPAYKAMFAYKTFEIIFCSTLYIGSKAFSL